MICRCKISCGDKLSLKIPLEKVFSDNNNDDDDEKVFPCSTTNLLNTVSVEVGTF